MSDKHAIPLLVADDEAPMRNLLASILRSCGYTNISHASDGQQALDALRAPRPPQLAFLDIQMPGFTGIELLELAGAAGPRPFCVIVSAHSDVANVLAALNAGAQGFIVKPYNARKVADILAKFETENRA